MLAKLSLKALKQSNKIIFSLSQRGFSDHGHGHGEAKSTKAASQSTSLRFHELYVKELERLQKNSY